jgi:hypothetical protein
VALEQYGLVVGAGLASLFGGTVLAIPFLLDLLNLPAELFQVFLSVDVLASRFGTLLAAMHLITVGLIGGYAMEGLIRVQPARLLGVAAISVLLLGGALGITRAYFTYIVVAPYTKAEQLASLHLLRTRQPAIVYRELEEGGKMKSRASRAPRLRLSTRVRYAYVTCRTTTPCPSSMIEAIWSASTLKWPTAWRKI